MGRAENPFEPARTAFSRAAEWRAVFHSMIPPVVTAATVWSQRDMFSWICLGLSLIAPVILVGVALGARICIWMGIKIASTQKQPVLWLWAVFAAAFLMVLYPVVEILFVAYAFGSLQSFQVIRFSLTLGALAIILDLLLGTCLRVRNLSFLYSIRRSLLMGDTGPRLALALIDRKLHGERVSQAIREGANDLIEPFQKWRTDLEQNAEEAEKLVERLKAPTLPSTVVPQALASVQRFQQLLNHFNEWQRSMLGKIGPQTRLIARLRGVSASDDSAIDKATATLKKELDQCSLAYTRLSDACKQIGTGGIYRATTPSSEPASPAPAEPGKAE